MNEAKIRTSKGGRNESPSTQRPGKPPEGMEGGGLRSQLRAWLKEICPNGKLEDYCQIMADSAAPEVMKVRVFTHDYRYTIIAKEKPGYTAYLGCTAIRRKSLAGVTDHTFAVLADTDFTRENWEFIKAAILRFELVKLTAKAKEEQWRKMCSYYESGGKQYYDEWLQKGERISQHKTYELVGEKEEGDKNPEDNQGARWAHDKIPGRQKVK